MRRVLNIGPIIRGLEIIPEHVLAISKLNAFDEELLNLMVKQIGRKEYVDALGTIQVMLNLLGKRGSTLNITNPKDAAYLRLNSIKKCLDNLTQSE